MTSQQLRMLGHMARQLGADSDVAAGYLELAAYSLERGDADAARLMLTLAAERHALYQPIVTMMGGVP